jgi:hypothetical protein
MTCLNRLGLGVRKLEYGADGSAEASELSSGEDLVRMINELEDKFQEIANGGANTNITPQKQSTEIIIADNTLIAAINTGTIAKSQQTQIAKAENVLVLNVTDTKC